MVIFRSKRLVFRTWEEKDLAPFAALNADAEVMAHFPKTYGLEETENMITELNRRFECNGYTFYAVDLAGSNEFIGFIGLNYAEMKTPFCPCTEIGWRLASKYWGFGYATEGAKACLVWAFKKLKLETIYSWTTKTNAKSEAVMQRIGMNKVAEFNHPELEKSHRLSGHVLYQIRSK